MEEALAGGEGEDPPHAARVRPQDRRPDQALPDALVEVKNATLFDGDRIRFPDAVSARGLKHLELLAAVVQQGLRGVMLYAINRPEGHAFSPADAIDPAYGRTLREVAAAGVEVLAVRIEHQGDQMGLGDEVALRLED